MQSLLEKEGIFFAMKYFQIILIAFCALFSNNAYGQVDPDEVDSTTIWIETLRFNFDTIAQGDSVMATFKMKNIGEKPFHIRQVFPSCGCSVVDYKKDPILPGETIILKVVFDSHGKEGIIENTFQMFSNANGGYHTFYLTGFVLGKE